MPIPAIHRAAVFHLPPFHPVQCEAISLGSPFSPLFRLSPLIAVKKFPPKNIQKRLNKSNESVSNHN
jgi:hypothetical protein